MIESLFCLNRMFSFQLCSFDWIDWWPFKAMYEDPRAHWSSSKCCAIGVSLLRFTYEIHRHLSKRLIFLFSTFFSQQFQTNKFCFQIQAHQNFYQLLEQRNYLERYHYCMPPLFQLVSQHLFTRFAVLMRYDQALDLSDEYRVQRNASNQRLRNDGFALKSYGSNHGSITFQCKTTISQSLIQCVVLNTVFIT